MGFLFSAAALAIFLRLTSGQKYDYGYTYNVQPDHTYSVNQSHANNTRASTPCRCGYKLASSRIVGGEETGVNEFPMMALVTYGGAPPAMRWGGTIIDKRYVLSCAHTFIYGTSNLFVVVGEHDVMTFNESPATKRFVVESVLIHPHYISVTNYYNDNDIALLRLDNDIVFCDRVGPACLPFSFQDKLFDFAGHTMTLLGWGRLKYKGLRTNVLRKVDVDVITQDACYINYPFLTAGQICTYAPLKDACQGDSGGPLLYTDPASSLLFLCGIISYGNGCAWTGGVKTRVSAFLGWILNNTPGAEYCNK